MPLPSPEELDAMHREVHGNFSTASQHYRPDLKSLAQAVRFLHHKLLDAPPEPEPIAAPAYEAPIPLPPPPKRATKA